MINFSRSDSYLIVFLFVILTIYIVTFSMPDIVHAQATTNPGMPTTTTTSAPITTTSEPITTTISVPVTTTMPVTTTIPTTTTTAPSEGIPTLGEWGMIIFMTIILGIGVVIIRKRRTEER